MLEYKYHVLDLAFVLDFILAFVIAVGLFAYRQVPKDRLICSPSLLKPKLLKLAYYQKSFRLAIPLAEGDQMYPDALSIRT